MTRNEASAPVAGEPIADIALLLEGTYPYVSGGVSSWVHQIISGLPELRFSLCFLGGDASLYGAPKYRLPPNVVHLEKHYLMSLGRTGRRRSTPPKPAQFADSARLHEAFRTPGAAFPPGLLPRLFSSLGAEHGLTGDDFLFGEESWRRICEEYSARCTDPSFVDYFWSIRTMHAPVFALAEIARSLPPSRACHAISTGYAGLLGALLRHRTGRPFLLTEHGIYTKERRIDLAQAEWIADPPEGAGASGASSASYVRGLWIRFFEGIGRLAYDAASPIVSLYEGNRQRQITDGADPARTRVVPNGVDITRFAALRVERPTSVPHVLGLLGRVVPIKDVKTFIRALRIVVNRLPDAEGWIIGPADEDPDYARECLDLIASLGLEGHVKLLGFRKPEEVLPRMGLLVLTSISEALPLVLLEGFASGLPAIATDVGACREIIEGSSVEDRALGAAGALTQIADPEATARAAIALLGDEGRWRTAQAAGIARVERYYAQPDMLAAYRSIYRQVISEDQAGPLLELG